MRVAFDARWNYHGGVRTYVSTVLNVVPEAAARRGVEVVAYEHPQRPLAISHSNLRKIELDSGCYSARAQFELALRTKRDGIDLLHTPFYLAPFLVTCPILITIHDVIPFLFPVYSGIRGALVRTGYRTSATRAKHILAVSETTRNDVVRILKVEPSKVTRVYLGVKYNLSCPADASSELQHLKHRYGIDLPYVMVLSTSNWKTKNLSASLEAIEEARNKSAVHFQTVVAGSPVGLDRSGWRGRLRSVVETGPIETGDLEMLYRNATLFITLSRYEGFGLQLAEGLASGTPCVVSDGGSLSEVAGDGAVVCSLSDKGAAARAIVELLANNERRRAISQKALARASQFSLDKMAEELLDLYAQLARNPATHPINNY